MFQFGRCIRAQRTDVGLYHAEDRRASRGAVVGTIKVVVDFDLCEGNGVCQALCPEVFEVTDDDSVRVNHEAVTPDRIEAVRKAVRRCPKAALRMEE